MYFNKNIGYYKPVTEILISRFSPHDRRIFYGDMSRHGDNFISEQVLLSKPNEQNKKEISIGDLVLFDDVGNIIGYYCF